MIAVQRFKRPTSPRNTVKRNGLEERGISIDYRQSYNSIIL